MQRGWVVSPHYRAAIDAIKAVRIERGLSQTEIARRVGKPQSFVSKIENFDRRLDVVEFLVIAEAIGIPPDMLLRIVKDAMPDGAKI